MINKINYSNNKLKKNPIIQQNLLIKVNNYRVMIKMQFKI